jgi:pyridoxine 5-phosphate synthase
LVFVSNAVLLRRVIDQMQALGFRVSLFSDADPAVPEKARAVGADRIELFTGPYGALYGHEGGPEQLNLLSETAHAAEVVGLGINAGHDLTLENLPAFHEALPQIEEVSIGHGITADALLLGFAEAVRRYNAALGN